MIDDITDDDLRAIAAVEDPLAVSVLMPTFTAGREVRQNKVRFKNLLGKVRETMDRRGIRSDQIESRLGGGEALCENEAWWQHQGHGLAWFADGSGSQTFRLPVEVEERYELGAHHYLRPLIVVPQENRRFFLLAVSQNRVRLFRGDRFQIDQLEPDDLPSDLRSALNIDEFTQSLQQHSTTSRQIAGDMTFHGQGGAGMEVQKRDEILPFFRRLDHVFRSHFGEQRLPLLFAGVDFLFPIFQQASNYAHLVDHPIEGNPDELKPKELQQGAMKAIRCDFDKVIDDAIATYHREVGRHEAGTDAWSILTAARDGLVDTLMLCEGDTRWVVERDAGKNFRDADPGSDGAFELGNEAAVSTLRTGGRVLSCPRDKMPDRHTMAAVFRAPIPA